MANEYARMTGKGQGELPPGYDFSIGGVPNSAQPAPVQAPTQPAPTGGQAGQQAYATTQPQAPQPTPPPTPIPSPYNTPALQKGLSTLTPNLPNQQPSTPPNPQAYDLAHRQLQQSGQQPQEKGNRSAIQGAVTQNTPNPAPQDPLVDQAYTTNPYIKQTNDQLMEWLNPENTTKQLKTFVDAYASDRAELAGLKVELMNNKRIMGGTEQDIRDEVTKAGGFATESQVQAMTLGRNKYLVANQARLTDLISTAQDAINTDVQMLGMQKDIANTQFNQRMSILNYQQENTRFMYNAAQEQFKTNLTLLGADGLYASMKNNPAMINYYEKLNNLPSGALATAATQKATERANELAKDKLQLEVMRSNLATDRLQRQKISSEMNPGVGDNPQLYAGLKPATATAVRAQVSAFKTEPLVQNFGTIQEGRNFAGSLDNKTTNPADDQALIYSLAKALDPGSVVREGEYATAQKYSQSWIQAYGKGVTQAISGTGFLSETARKNIKDTIETKYKSSLRSYDNISNQYKEGINNLTGRDDGDKFIRNYVTPSGSSEIASSHITSQDTKVSGLTASGPWGTLNFPDTKSLEIFKKDHDIK